MGNHLSHRRLDATAKLIHPDGTVDEFNQPITVAELMLEYPQRVVVEFESLGQGNRPIPLPADKKLDTKKVYVMLRMKQGKVALSSDETRRILLNVKEILRSGCILPSIKILPLFARMCQVRNGVGHEAAALSRKDSPVRKLEKDDKVELLSEVFDERRAFLSRGFSGKGWKPNLDTIKEKGAQKVSHWLF